MFYLHLSNSTLKAALDVK